MQMELDQLKEASGIETGSPYHAVLKAVASFGLMIVDGVVSKIVAEQRGVVEDGRGILVMDEIPPVLPVDLCGMTPRDFSRAVQNQKDGLLAKVSEDDIEAIDAQFRRLRIAYREETGLKVMLDAVHSQATLQAFKDSWSLLGEDYHALKEYCCGGIATSVMPGTSLVESDFSLINWTRDPHSKSLTDFSLESILNCKQYRTLESLST
ncbi:hypothetical protein MHU86_16757 [Fragilaria crotonensis]|nr:hypothetical protein MHU86_16757 [Fragilaria crotonensis]